MRKPALILVSFINFACIGSALVLWLLPISAPIIPASTPKSAVFSQDRQQVEAGSLPERSFFRPVVETLQVEPSAPPSNEENGVNPAQPALPIRLVGLMENSQGRIAFVKLGATQELQRRIVGEPIEDWILSRIDHRSIEIRKGHEVKTIALDPGLQP